WRSTGAVSRTTHRASQRSRITRERGERSAARDRKRPEGRMTTTRRTELPQLPDAAELERRIKLVDEHVKAEVDHDLDAIMRTWGKSPWFDDVAWEEKSYGHDELRAHY